MAAFTRGQMVGWMGRGNQLHIGIFQAMDDMSPNHGLVVTHPGKSTSLTSHPLSQIFPQSSFNKTEWDDAHFKQSSRGRALEKKEREELKKEKRKRGPKQAVKAKSTKKKTATPKKKGAAHHHHETAHHETAHHGEGGHHAKAAHAE